jgi:hypothetical protein
MATTSYSFIAGSTLETTARIFTPSEDHDHDTLVSILSAAQEGRLNFLPLTWLPGQEHAGVGGQAEIYQYGIRDGAGLVFKALRIWMEDWPDGEHDSRRSMGVSAMIKEISILSQPLVLSNPHILQLQGVSWNAQKAFAWPALVYQRGITLREYLLRRSEKGLHLNLENKLRICASICSGLSALHQSGKYLLALTHIGIVADRPRNCPCGPQASQHHYGQEKLASGIGR